MAREHIVRSYDSDIDQIVGAIVRMGAAAEAQVAGALAVLGGEVRDAAELIENDDRLDLLEESIDQMAVRLFALRQPMAVDLRLIAMSLKISNDLERIGDYAASVAKRATRAYGDAPGRVPKSLLDMGERVRDMLSDVLDAYAERDATTAMKVWHRDGEVDALYKALCQEQLESSAAAPRGTSACVDCLFIAKNLERIGDHATNIAERIHYVVHGDRINRIRHEPEAEPADVDG